MMLAQECNNLRIAFLKARADHIRKLCKNLRVAFLESRADNIRPYKERRIEKMDLPQRTKIRIEGYDYSSQGMYFITICVTDRHALLWDFSADVIQPNPAPLSQYGMIVQTAIQQIPAHYRNVSLDKFCIMPDHVHFIVFIQPDENGHHHPQSSATEKTNRATISTLVGSMKRWVSKQIGFSIWQKSFHDRILWNQRDYREVWEYINENPIHYAEDRIDDSLVLPCRSL